MAVTEPGLDVGTAFTRYRLGLTRLAVLLVDDLASAEDVVQDAFAALHRHRSDLREEHATYAYLRKAVANNAHNVLRRRTLARRTVPAHGSGTGPPADEELLLAEEQRAVLAAVRTLPPRQREIVVLRYWSDLSEADIAEALGISRGAVKSQASRALDKLERLLEASS